MSLTELHVVLLFFYFSAENIFLGTERDGQTLDESDLPLALDNVYADLQGQANSTGAYAMVIATFPYVQGDEKQRLQATYKPKLILPRKTVIAL